MFQSLQCLQEDYQLVHFLDFKAAIWGVSSLTHSVNMFYVTDGNIMYLTDASRFLISCVIQHYAPVVGWGGVDYS